MQESKSCALPLGYEAKLQVVESGGFEPPNPKEQIYSLPRLASSLSLQKNGAENRNRTNDTKIFSLVLCQLSYEATMAVPTGIEPAIPRVTGECDNRYTTEPYFWLQEKDLNLRPLGYEPNELPGCSILRC